MLQLSLPLIISYMEVKSDDAEITNYENQIQFMQRTKSEYLFLLACLPLVCMKQQKYHSIV